MASNIGHQFESYLDELHQFYEAEGRALIRKVDPPTKVTRDKGIFFVGTGLPDFIGVINGGRFVVCEAKATADQRGFNRSALKSHQRGNLDKISSLGGAAVLLLLKTPDSDSPRAEYVIPWERRDELPVSSTWMWGALRKFKCLSQESWLDTWHRLSNRFTEDANI